LAHTIADAALEKLATDVVILDLRELDAVTDCFVICTGDVDQHVRAIAGNIEKQVKAKTTDRLLHREGTQTLNWVILDYVNVVVHIFKPTFREFYRLENLWGDADAIAVEDKAAAKPKSVTRKTPAKKVPAKKPAAKKKPATAGRKSSSRSAKAK
jgi:ribosome-associated protein